MTKQWPYRWRDRFSRWALAHCGTWGCSSQWQVRADHNTYRPICRGCDVALNAMVLTWMGHPETVDLIASYELIGGTQMSARDDHERRVLDGVSEELCWRALFDEIDRLRAINASHQWQASHALEEIDRLRANLDEANSEWADAIAQRDTARHDLATIREATL